MAILRCVLFVLFATCTLVSESSAQPPKIFQNVFTTGCIDATDIVELLYVSKQDGHAAAATLYEQYRRQGRCFEKLFSGTVKRQVDLVSDAEQRDERGKRYVGEAYVLELVRGGSGDEENRTVFIIFFERSLQS